jgi:DeoR/GlpR family transcriptional regulator of sugar metabolism
MSDKFPYVAMVWYAQFSKLTYLITDDAEETAFLKEVKRMSAQTRLLVLKLQTSVLLDSRG